MAKLIKKSLKVSSFYANKESGSIAAIHETEKFRGLIMNIEPELDLDASEMTFHPTQFARIEEGSTHDTAISEGKVTNAITFNFFMEE